MFHGIENPFPGIVHGESAPGAQPDHTGPVFINQFDPLIGKNVVLVSGRSKYCNILTVISVEAVFGAKPHEALGILGDVVHRTEGETIVNGDPFKTHIFLLPMQCGQAYDGQGEKGKYSSKHPGSSVA